MISPFAIPAPGSIGAGSNQVKASSSAVSASAEGSDLIGVPLISPIYPVGIASKEVFSLPQITHHAAPVGIPSEEALGNPDVSTLGPVGIASEEGVSTPQLDLGVIAAGVETASVIGTFQLNLSLYTVAIPALVGIGAGSGSVKASSDSILASSHGDLFGSTLMELGLATAGIVSSEGIGATELSLIGEPAGVASGEAFGTARVDTYTVTVGITSQESFGTQYLYPLQMIYAAGVISDEAFGTTAFPFYLRPPGISTAEAVPLPAFTSLVIRPELIETAGQLGTPSIDFSLEIPGVASEEGVGLAQCNSFVDVVGIPSEEAIGQAGLLTSVVPTAIQTSEAFGIPGAIHEVAVTGVSTAEAVGQAKLTSLIDSIGITSVEAFGTARISAGLLPYGIVSLEEVPEPFFFDLVLYVPSIPTQESVGAPTVGEPAEAQIIEPSFLASKEKFGTPTLRSHITTVGIPSETVFGYIPSITESHELFVPDIIYSEEAFGEPLVLPNYTASPDDLNSTPTITTPALGQRHILSPAYVNAYPTQSVFVLLQDHQLGVEQAAVTPVIPSLLLSQNYQLVVESPASTPFMSHVYFGGLSYFGDPGVESGSDVKAYRDKLADQVVSSQAYGFRAGILSSTPVAIVVGTVLASNDEVTSDAGDVSASGAVLEFEQRTVISSRGYESADSGYADKLHNEVISIGSKGLSSGALSVYPDRDTVITNRGLTGSGTKGWRGKRTG